MALYPASFHIFVLLQLRVPPVVMIDADCMEFGVMHAIETQAVEVCSGLVDDCLDYILVVLFAGPAAGLFRGIFESIEAIEQGID